MFSKHKHWQLLYIIAILIALVAIAFSLRTPIFRFMLSRVAKGLSARHNVYVEYESPRIIGINNFYFESFTAGRNTGSVSVHAAQVSAKIPVWRLLTFNLKPSILKIDSLEVKLSPTLHQNDSAEDYNAASASEKEQALNVGNNVGKLLSIRHIHRFFGVVPFLASSKIAINHLSASFIQENNEIKVVSHNFSNSNGEIFSQLSVYKNGIESRVEINGHAFGSGKGINVKVKSIGSKKVDLPFNVLIPHLDFRVDSIHFSFLNQALLRDSIYTVGFAELFGIRTYHYKLANEYIDVKYAGINFGSIITPEKFSLDSTSHIAINKIIIPVELLLSNSFKPRVKVDIHTDEQDASGLFEAIPKGLFSNIDGIKVQGKTKFDLSLDLDLAQPDSLRFQVNLKPIGFRILSLGKVDFREVCDTFTYTTYLADSLTRKIKLAPLNRNYRTLGQISPYLKNAVITAEDGGFYYHKGFDSDGFRYAMARNIKQRRLYRGGSTITMQLVKNLYLNRHKQLLRKLEEALIVWLIETQRLVEKDRILEIYLNIIDWGPNINGIAEASKFYFDKDPMKLELNEAIFLASIIPNPNNYTSNFDSLGNFKTGKEDYFRFIAQKMQSRGMIAEEECQNLIYGVALKGPAKEYLHRDSIAQ